MERECDGPICEQHLETHQSAVFVRQQKGRHRIAHLRRARASIASLKVGDEPVHRRRVGGNNAPNHGRVRIQPDGERRIHVAAVYERLSQGSEFG